MYMFLFVIVGYPQITRRDKKVKLKFYGSDTGTGWNSGRHTVCHRICRTDTPKHRRANFDQSLVGFELTPDIQPIRENQNWPDS